MALAGGVPRARLVPDSRQPCAADRGPAPVPRQGGFTLLEILIAFVIAAIALGVLFGGAAEGLRASRAALGYEEAIARARSHLAASRVNPAPGDEQGDDGSGFRWRVLIRPMDQFRPRATGQPTASQSLTDGPGMAVSLYSITVWVTWREAGQTRELRLDSESLLPEAPARPSPRPGRG